MTSCLLEKLTMTNVVDYPNHLRFNPLSDKISPNLLAVLVYCNNTFVLCWIKGAYCGPQLHSLTFFEHNGDFDVYYHSSNRRNGDCKF